MKVQLWRHEKEESITGIKRWQITACPDRTTHQKKLVRHHVVFKTIWVTLCERRLFVQNVYKNYKRMEDLRATQEATEVSHTLKYGVGFHGGLQGVRVCFSFPQCLLKLLVEEQVWTRIMGGDAAPTAIWNLMKIKTELDRYHPVFTAP